MSYSPQLNRWITFWKIYLYFGQLKGARSLHRLKSSPARLRKTCAQVATSRQVPLAKIDNVYKYNRYISISMI